jgi:hypothetical protein
MLCDCLHHLGFYILTPKYYAPKHGEISHILHARQVCGRILAVCDLHAVWHRLFAAFYEHGVILVPVPPAVCCFLCSASMTGHILRVTGLALRVPVL